MGRAPCCDKTKVKRGPWSPDEDNILRNYVEKHSTAGSWIALPQKAGLKRCGKSCRLRWLNYLRPNIKHGGFTEEEDNIILTLYRSIGSRWSVIASKLPGRTDNDVKNYWNTKLKKKLLVIGIATATTTTTTSNFIVTSKNNINLSTAYSRNSKVDNMLSYFPKEDNYFHQESVAAEIAKRSADGRGFFPLPGLMELPENVQNASYDCGLLPSAPLISQQAVSSTLSPSFSVDNNAINGSSSVSWSTHGSAEDDAFLISELMTYELLNAFDFQEIFTDDQNDNLNFG